MIQEDILNMIIDEVFRRLEARRKRSLVIFTGAAIGFQDAICSLKELLSDGWDLKIFLSKSAEHVFTPKLIKEQLGIEEVFLESNVKGLQDLYKDVSSFIIPTLTLNTAAKVSLGIADTMSTNLIAHGIMEGIQIVAAKDGCDLNNTTRLKLGMNKTPQSYLSTFDRHLANLEGYGIKLVEAKDIYEYLTVGKASVGSEVATGEKSRAVNTYSDANNSAVILTESFKLNKKVISRSDIMNVRNTHTVLEISGGTIVTPLAWEAAKQVGLTVKQV